MSEVTTACRMCGSTGPHQTFVVREMYFGTREQFDYFSCADCDSVQIVDALEGEDLMRHYPNNYYSYVFPVEPGLRQWLTLQEDRFKTHMGGQPVGALIAAFPQSIRVPLERTDSSGDVIGMLGKLGVKSGTRILDVGCGSGVLLDRLARAGFTELCGADPFLEADGTTPLGVPLMKRYLGEVPGEFDLIMFNHSLEHMPDPVETLKVARDKLADGGACLVRLPTTSSEAWPTYGADWIAIDAPRHIVVPSRPGMAAAAKTAGLSVEETYDDSSFIQFLASEAYRRDIPLSDPGLYGKMVKVFGPKQVWDWQRRAQKLNRQGRGDWTGFVLRANGQG